MVPSRSASMPRPGIAHRELHKVLDLFGGQQNLSLGRRVANGIGEQVVQDGAHRAPVGLHIGEIGVGRDLDANALLRGLVAEAVAGLVQELQGARRSSVNSRRPASSSATSIRSPIRSSSFSLSLLAAATSSACKGSNSPAKPWPSA
jgi:hypothetical protein